MSKTVARLITFSVEIRCITVVWSNFSPFKTDRAAPVREYPTLFPATGKMRQVQPDMQIRISNAQEVLTETQVYV